MCLLPATAAGLDKPKTAALGLISPAAAVVSAMSKGKKKKDATPIASSNTSVGTLGPSPSTAQMGY